MTNEKISKELISLIEQKTVGFSVKISRSVKTGRTATEISNISLEGNAETLDGAKEVLKTLDDLTMKFIDSECNAYGIDKKQIYNTASPVEKKF